MPFSLFQNILNISLSMTPVIILFIIIFPKLNLKYSANFRHILWVLIAVRLILPITISLPTKINFNPATTITQNNTNINLSQFVPLNTDNVNTPISPISSMSFSYSDIFFIIWISGCIILFSINIISYFTVFRQLKRWRIKVTNPQTLATFNYIKQNMGIPNNIKIYSSKYIEIPMLVGFINSSVYLPERDFNDNEIYNILNHELWHYKRKDIWFKLILLLANCIHWFNPTVYFMIKQADLDMEMACDHSILRNSSSKTRKQYGLTILSFAEKNNIHSSTLTTYFYGGKKQMKLRFLGIVNKTTKKFSIIIACICMAALILCGSCEYKTPIEKTAEKPSFEQRRKTEYRWIMASIDLRKALETPAYTDTDLLCYIESVDGNQLTTYSIAREADNVSGNILENIMLDDEDSPTYNIDINNTTVDIISIKNDTIESETIPGTVEDIKPDSIISVWGEFNNEEHIFIADHITVWKIKER